MATTTAQPATTGQSEYTAVWTTNVEDSADDDVGSSRVTTSTQPQQGPLSRAIEGTQWTREDIELAVEILKGTALLLTLYYSYTGGGDAL